MLTGKHTYLDACFGSFARQYPKSKPDPSFLLSPDSMGVMCNDEMRSLLSAVNLWSYLFDLVEASPSKMY
ncbi:uncharacterized protein ARMOST_05964 [Armillaria ostoyae]|uniref:Uncharacterized protein n=1 Tax=Armillaria ostoyae TaxID=47428 RepID=A0A284R1Q8_ARMOS|nr:uncharacterized protein ARMOST_05964 [Armillaria ostoyae]